MATFASGKNWGTSPDQSTFTSDIGSATRLATSGAFARYLTDNIIEKSLMIQSGLIATDARLDNVTGVLVELPFFDALDYIEENVDSSNTWGTGGEGRYQTQKHTASTQYGTIVTRGAGFAADMLSQYETGEKSLENVALQLTRKINKDTTAKVVSMFTGLFGSALEDNSYNVAAAAGETPGIANYLTADNVTTAKYLLGENADDVSVIVVHPLVKAYMERQKMLVFENSTGTVEYATNGVGVTSTAVGYFAGLRVVTDSQVPKVEPDSATTGDAMGYTCYIGAPGVIRTGSQFPMLVKRGDDALSLQEVMSVTYNTIHHVLGTSYGGTPHPLNSVLGDKSNWSLAYGSAQSVPLVELIVNTPSGQTVA